MLYIKRTKQHSITQAGYKDIKPQAVHSSCSPKTITVSLHSCSVISYNNVINNITAAINTVRATIRNSSAGYSAASRVLHMPYFLDYISRVSTIYISLSRLFPRSGHQFKLIIPPGIDSRKHDMRIHRFSM